MVQVTLGGEIAEEIVKKRKRGLTCGEKERIKDRFENENGRITDWAETEE